MKQGASVSIRLFPSGTLFCPFEPRPEDIHVEDVAHALSRIGRFGEHTAARYSVAQHCLIVSDLCVEYPMWGLLHEIAEALSGMGDVCGPTKRHASLAGPIKALEHGIEDAASIRFGLPTRFASHPVVKFADDLAYAWEDRDLRPANEDDAWVNPLREKIPVRHIVPMDWKMARDMFLLRFWALGGN